MRFLIFVIILFSCQKNEKKQFDTSKVTIEKTTFSKVNNGLNILLNYPDFISEESIEILDSIEKEIHRHLFKFEDDERAAISADDFFDRIFIKFEAEKNRFPGSELNWNIRREVSVDKLNNDLISLKIKINDNTGSGFDFEKIYFKQIDPKKGKVIEINDIVLTEKLTDFYSLHQEKMSEKLKTKSFTSKDIDLFRSFYFSDTSIVFHYNKFQLMPYTENELSLEYNISELDALLNSQYKHLWKND